MRVVRKIIGLILVLFVVSLPFWLSTNGRGVPEQTERGVGNVSTSMTDNNGRHEVSSAQVTVSEPIIPSLSPAVRDLPEPELEYLLDREVNPRINYKGDLDPNFRVEGGLDPLLAVQEAASDSMALPTLLQNFDGIATGSSPHDPVGDVGPNYYIQATNGGGTAVRIIDKTNGSTVSNFTLDSLGSGSCASGLGDPIVLYDRMADRWFLSEFSSSDNRLCMYVSQTSDPLGSYYAYNFQSVNSFPDYPKYGVWPDAYYVGTNESTSTVYAFDRATMLTGGGATFQSFNVPDLSGFGFQMIPPADLDGALPPPAGTPGYFMRHRDTEVHGAGTCPSAATQDCLELYEFDVDWATPGNSTFTKAADIPVTEFDSDLCGLTSFFCFPQQGSSTTLDPLREVIMWRLQYRNFGEYEVLVANQVTDVDGTDHGGVRWYELRRNGGSSWNLYQEGTFAPDAAHRFMGSIAMDGSGNIGLAYSITSLSMYPSIRYTGREATDPLGTMSGTEVTVHNGTGSSGSNRWGDYSSLNIDPDDDCTFWYTMEYGAGGTRRTRIASFKFDSCSGGIGPNFSLATTPNAQDICTAEDAVYSVAVAGLDGFLGDVTLATVGEPGTPVFSNNPVTPDASSILTISGATVGNYSFDITGQSVMTPSMVHTNTVGLNVFNGSPSAPTLTTPANGAASVPFLPTFTWSATTATNYLLEVATDTAFTNVVYTATVSTNSHTATSTLASSTTYYWRVSGDNTCGSSSYSSTFNFTTQSGSLVCNGGTVEFESGIPADFLTEDNGGNVFWTTTGDTGCSDKSNQTGGTGQSACADADDTNYPPSAYDAEMWTNEFDLSSVFTATVDFRWRHDPMNGSVFAVDVSTNGGASWTNEINNTAGNPGGDSGDAASIDLSSYIGQSNVIVRYRFYGDDWDWYAQIDDLSLDCSIGEPNYGVVLSGDAAISDAPGEVVTYTLAVTNTGNVADTYTVAISDIWGASAPASVTVGAGSSSTFDMGVTIPTSAMGGDYDVATVTVTSDNDPTATDSADLTTTAVEFYVFLPMITR